MTVSLNYCCNHLIFEVVFEDFAISENDIFTLLAVKLAKFQRETTILTNHPDRTNAMFLKIIESYLVSDIVLLYENSLIKI